MEIFVGLGSSSVAACQDVVADLPWVEPRRHQPCPFGTSQDRAAGAVHHCRGSQCTVNNLRGHHRRCQ